MTKNQSFSDVELILDNTQPSETNEPTSFLPTVTPYVTFSEFQSSLTQEQQFSQWDRDILPLIVKPNSQKVQLKRYFMTFTRDPSNGTKLAWFDLLMKALRQSVHQFQSGTIEHMDKNIHCHAYVTSKYNLSKDRYKLFSKHHSMNIKKVNHDNGVVNYMTKENDPIDSLDKFEKYFIDEILKIN